MASNFFGSLIRLTTFGESHGPAIGGVVDGLPAGAQISIEKIQEQLDRRRPGQSALTTQRNESDAVEIISGLFDGKTTGTPLAFIIKNKDAKSKDYGHLKDLYRPSHADFTYEEKYGIRDYRGGGRASARETAVRVAAGALVSQLIPEIKITAWVEQIGPVAMPAADSIPEWEKIDANLVRCPHAETAKEMQALIERLKAEGDSIGGIIKCVAENVPAGLGEPVYHKLEAALAAAMLSINAVKGFDFGSGFAQVHQTGSQLNDAFGEGFKTLTNHSGGIQGGISNGSPVYFRVAFKPVATIAQKQQTITRQGQQTELEAKGRHDPCVLPRALPIVEAMTALVLADFWMHKRLNRL